MTKFIAACSMPSVILAADSEGFCYEITTESGDKPYIDRQTSTTLEIRQRAKSCAVYTLLMLDIPTFQKLCHNLTEHTNNWYREDYEYEQAQALHPPMIILTELAYHRAEARQDNKPVTLFYGLSGQKPGDRWHCRTSWCTNHHNCQHVVFATTIIPTEAILIPVSPEQDYSDLIDA